MEMISAAGIVNALKRIDENRSTEDSINAPDIVIDGYHDPTLERPEYLAIGKPLALRNICNGIPNFRSWTFSACHISESCSD